MNAGEEIRFYCSECQTEYDLTLEPKVENDSTAAKTMPGKHATHCPFCGSKEIEEV